MKKASHGRLGKLALLCAAEAGIIWGILQAAKVQARQVDAAVTEISDLKDPSPFRAALLGHLDKINLSLSAYVRSPDPALLKQISESARDFENSLPEFERQNKRLFPPAAGEAIRNNYEAMKSSLHQAVELSAKRSERRASVDQNFKQMLFLIDHRIRPLLRKDNPDERLDSILNVENQLRAWQQNLNQAWVEPSDSVKGLASENDSKGQSLLEDHEQMTQSAAERRAVKDLSALWKAAGGLVRQNLALETVQTQALNLLKADRDKLNATLSHLLPAMRPEDLERKKQAILRSIRNRLILTGLLGLVGVVSLAGACLLAYRLWRPPAEGRWKSTLEIDLKGTIIHWSQAATDLYGYSDNEVRGRSIAMLFAAESEIGRLHQQMQSGDQTTFNTTHKIKGGATIPVRVRFLPITDGSRQLAAIGLACARR